MKQQDNDSLLVAKLHEWDPDWGEKVTALVVLKPGTEIGQEELQKHCRAYLAGYKVPKTVLFENSLPLTPSGKVQKGPLRERFRNN